MSQHESGPREAVEGIVEDVKGKAKEAAGIITGDENLKDEGRAQQDKAADQRKAAQKEAEAEKARAEAEVNKARQSGHEHNQ
ncbi:CsbD family protein [Nocardia terpenica]|uniref:General stress protein CsbD n=1 Tax=Nocardia terpenica TaxID=455432 RepID=A0A164IZS6_9NOCA|nr:CsbD family protein [Nocardia terpenica]KZM69899.1 general stress protein CsbD [Nocardia terpenica]MBF6065986.1 CsbD family protein [Nocardia terpenica]MBF6108818.1 CsbD family protein [Nocardia terpenica]MBF6116230.1 CsbD family protein [Nocardia terpenica]MBF6123231.1 CsbD family protein [Nocardia terpenica]